MFTIIISVAFGIVISIWLRKSQIVKSELTLQLFIRQAVCMIMQTRLGNKLNYQETYFFLPRIICKDGFNISIQVNHNSYCSTENGYREFGYEWKTAEWGFPNQHEPLLVDNAEYGEDTTSSVGSESIEVLQQVIDNHGGFDWNKMLSPEHLKHLNR